MLRKQGRRNNWLKLSKFFCRWIYQLLDVVGFKQYNSDLLFSSPIAILAKAEILAKKLKEDFTELIEKKQKGNSNNQEVSVDWSVPFPYHLWPHQPITPSKDRD